MKSRSPLAHAVRLCWPVLILCAVLLLPFLNKAFTVDDTLFLLQAQQLRASPLHPTAFEVVWTDVPRRLSAIMPSGPIMAYLLLPSVMLGGAEWAAHLLQLILLWVAVVATVALGLRLGLGPREARRAGLFLAVTPAVLGMAATAMPDVAAMAFGALFMERYVAWEKTRRRLPLVGAAGMLALSILTRSHLILLCGVAMLYSCGQRELHDWRTFLRPPRRVVVPLGGGLIITMLALWLTSDPGRDASSIVGAAQELARIRFFPSNLLAFFSHWALSLPLTLPWAVLRFPSLRWSALKYLIPIFVSIIAVTTSPKTIWVAPIAGISALALYDIVKDAVTRRDALQLTLGAWILLALPVAIYIHMPPKYLIVSAPAMAILISRRLSDDKLPLPRVARHLGRAIAVVGVVLGVLIIRVDVRFSEMGRSAAKNLIAPRVARGERVWFAGHWGFQFYAMQAGALCLTRTPPHPVTGEIVVASEHAQGQIIEAFPLRRLIATYVLDAPGGRIMSEADGAGFFSNGWGYLPYTFTFSRSEIERINVWQME